MPEWKADLKVGRSQMKQAWVFEKVEEWIVSTNANCNNFSKVN
jgi:hypothetical protein